MLYAGEVVAEDESEVGHKDVWDWNRGRGRGELLGGQEEIWQLPPDEGERGEVAWEVEGAYTAMVDGDHTELRVVKRGDDVAENQGDGVEVEGETLEGTSEAWDC